MTVPVWHMRPFVRSPVARAAAASPRRRSRSRPSTITTSSHAARRARARQARSLAIMPAVAVPSPISGVDAARIEQRDRRAVARRARRRSSPAMTSRRAPSRRPGAAANVSALTLRSRPPSVDADARDHRHEADGARSVGQQRRRARPTRDGRRGRDRPSAPSDRAVRRRRPSTGRTSASAPVRPTARTPAATSAATSRVLTVPASTATTTSSVGASVMRRPSTCRFSMPARRQRGVDLLAAAVDDRRAGPRPASAAIDVDARRRGRRRVSSSSPPNFRSVTVAASRASQQPRPLVEAEHDVHVLHRLARRALEQVVEHRHENQRGPIGSSTRQPMSQKFVCATCLISGSAVADERARTARPRRRRRRRRRWPRSVVPGATRT